MERIFRKTEEETYPRKIFAHQLITIYDLQQFRKQLMEELLIAIKAQPSSDNLCYAHPMREFENGGYNKKLVYIFF